MRSLIAPLALMLLAACKPTSVGGGSGGSTSSSSSGESVSTTSTSTGGAGGQDSTSTSTGGAATGSTGAGGESGASLWSLDVTGTCLASDPAGNVVVARDAHLVKIDPSGSVVWEKDLYPAKPPNVEMIALDAAGNVFLVGNFGGIVNLGGETFECPTIPTAECPLLFVAKLDPDGNHLWSRVFGDGLYQDNPMSMVIDGTGNVVFTGGFTGSIDFGDGIKQQSPSGGDANRVTFFLTKLDGSSGALVWDKVFSTGVPQVGRHGLAIDGAGHVIITGLFRFDLDFGGGPLKSITAVDDSYDMFLAKFTSVGVHIWSKGFGIVYEDESGLAVAATPAGELVVLGTSEAGLDLGKGSISAGTFLARFDAGGTNLWSKPSFGSTLALDSAGDIVVATGVTGNTPVDFGGGALLPQGSKDVVAARLDAGGNHIWSKRFGTTALDTSLTDLACDSAGNAILIGHYAKSIDFGSGPLTCGGYNCGYVAKVGP